MIVKNFENPAIFGQDIDKNLWFTFLANLVHCVPEKYVTTFYTHIEDYKCLITIIFGVVSLCVIERWLHFPPQLSSATALP